MGKTELKLEIDADLLRRAKEAGIELASAAEAGLHLALARRTDADRPIGIQANALLQKADPVGAAERSRKWAEENAAAIEAHKARIEREGVFGEDLRTW